MKIKKLPIILSAFIISSTMFSCSTTTLLNATFESDPINSHPAANLPGPPSGDVIQYVPGFEPQLVVKSGITSAKALYFIDAATSDTVGRHDSWVSFKGNKYESD